jgi:hypothetical protein
MKILRTSAILLLGFSLTAPAALAEPPSLPSCFEWIYRLIHPSDPPEGDINHTNRQCDQNGQNSGRGNNCDRGRGNGGGYCGTGGSTSGGSTTPPPLPKSS